MKNQCQHSTKKHFNELLQLLQKFKELFDGTLGNWKTYPVHFELKSNAKPIFPIPYPVFKVHNHL